MVNKALLDCVPIDRHAKENLMDVNVPRDAAGGNIWSLLDEGKVEGL